MKQRIITALVLILTIVPALYLWGTYFTIVAVLFAAVGGYEITAIVSKKWPSWMKYLLIAMFVLSVLAVLWRNELMFACIAVMIMVLLTMLVWSKDIGFEQIGIVLFVHALCVGLIGSLDVLHKLNSLYPIGLLIGTYVTDSFCLFGGMLLGKHKLNERISPNKTIEGALSGWLCGFIASMVFYMLAVKNAPMGFVLPCSLLIPVAGQLGDLAFSAIKREFGIKDYGNIFPGHGGVLDRIDSLTFTGIMMYIIAVITL